MSGYLGLNLSDMITQLGENEVKSILSEFSCPMNKDVEHFLRHTAIEFAKQGIASTYIIMASYRDEYVLAGYFTLANKIFCMNRDSFPNMKWKRRIAKFGQFDSTIKRYTLSAPLIGQLGKNYSHNYDKLITGDELLKLALDKVAEMQRIVGGKIVYLECEDKPKLLEFYSENGFVNFGKRMLDRDETSTLSGEYLVQMLRYM